MYYHKFVNVETNEETITELTAAEVAVIETNIAAVNAELADQATKASARQTILDRLGITSEEAQLILGGSN